MFRYGRRPRFWQVGMKRHPSLIPLSHDHHDGLVVAQNLILGQSKAPRSTWPTERRQQVDRLLAFFGSGLRAHFRAEEELVFPVVARQLKDGAELVRQLRVDHDEMRAEIRALEQDPESDLDVRLPAFGERLKRHIQNEERVLFERMQEEMDAQALDAIGAALRSIDGSGPSGSCQT